MSKLSIRFKKAEAVWYLAPGLVVVAFVFLYSIIRVVQISFMRIAKTVTEVDQFVGFNNYKMLFTESSFIDAIKHNALFLLIVPAVLTLLAIIISSILFDQIRGWKIYRSLIFLPYILAIPVVGVVFSYIFQQNGILNTFFRFIHLDFLAINWLGSPKYALYTIMIIIIWKELGFGVILFFARLSSVDEEIYEAAKIDGANWWQILRYIHIPQLSTIIEFFMIIEAINMVSWVFNYIFVITAQGGPGTSTYILEYFIWLNAFRFYRYGYSAAAAVILLIFTSLLIWIWMRVRNRAGEESL